MTDDTIRPLNRRNQMPLIVQKYGYGQGLANNPYVVEN